MFDNTQQALNSLSLPTGGYAINFAVYLEDEDEYASMPTQQSVSPEDTIKAAKALLESGQEFSVNSQAELIVLSQQRGLAFIEYEEMLLVE